MNPDRSSFERLQKNKLAPVIRGANLIRTPSLHFGPRRNYAVQLVYVFSGSCRAIVEDRIFELIPGTVIFYGPGQQHEVMVASHSRTEIATICFSWTYPGEDKLAFGNAWVRDVDDVFWQNADHPQNAEGLPEIPFVLTISEVKRTSYEMILRDVIKAFKNSEHLLCRAKFLESLHLLQPTVEKSTHPVIVQALDFLGANYQHPIRRRDVSDHVGISESHLTTLLRQELGSNLTRELKAIRMSAARDLLEHTNLHVKEVAVKVGYQDASYFVLTYRTYFGHPPGAARG